MNTNPTLQDRAVEAAARFLEVRGYETLATGWKDTEMIRAIFRGIGSFVRWLFKAVFRFM